ncbi:MFS transporter [Caballeronia telluris]|uniref:Transmembrane sugar transporter n=1 Tax=Caballeronia telluris TaxID=326475 RepID=A0A158JI20_9BURK|nr:MFS transporter [Caballeronia telluris]SAL68071.1 transmembrane sugar transporter [Caballeronia telluris]
MNNRQTAPPEQASLGAQIVTLACTLAIQAVATAATLAFPILAPAIPGVQPAAVGVFLAVVYFGAMIGSVIGSAVVTGLGPVRASQAALLLQALALALLSVDNANLRLLAALLCGLGYGPITPASSQILARTTPAARMGIAFSLKQTGVPLGGLLTGAALPFIATFFSWKTGLAGLAVLAAAVSLVSSPLRTLDAEATGRLVISTTWYRPIAEVLAHPQLRSMAVVSLLFSACQLSVSGYLMAFLHREAGMGLAQAGVIYAVAQGAGIAGRLLWGHLADRIGSSRRVLMAVCVLMALSCVATGSFATHWGIEALCVVSAVFGATAIGWNGVFLGELARLAPRGAVASVTGGALFFTYFGVVVGPPAFGYLAERTSSLGFAYVALGVVPCIALALLCLPDRQMRRRAVEKPGCSQ